METEVEFEILVKCADILCLPGANYAVGHTKCPEKLRSEAPDWHDDYDKVHVRKEDNNFNFPVDPFRVDMLEYVNQANVLEDWLMVNHYPLWQQSNTNMTDYPVKPYSEHGAFWQQNRLLRIHWCIKQIILQELMS